MSATRLAAVALAATGALACTIGPASLASRQQPAWSEASSATKHVIGVRVRDGAGELFDRRTKKAFVVRGTNYLRLDDAPKDPLDALLDPRASNLTGIRSDFRTLRGLGFNTVRIFLDLCRIECIGDRSGLNPRYLDKLARVLRVAKQEHLLLLPTLNEWDGFVGYRSAIPRATFAGSFNGLYLTSEGIKATSRFFTDVIRGLQKRKAPLEAVLAWELRNEQFFDYTNVPFTRTSGRVRTANGKTYDLADPAAKLRLMDDGIRTYVARVRAAIRKADPGVLVTMGFFNPQPASDPRIVRTAPLLARSALDFFDFHYYPGGSITLAQAVRDFGMAGRARKPIVLGEYGAFKFAYPSPDEGAAALVDLQVQSCAAGFDGWLYWLETPQDRELWTGGAAGAAIRIAMSPQARPDPCVFGATTVRNLAQGKPVRASRSVPSSPPEHAVDGDAESIWTAGEDAPQWIEIDLGSPSSVTKIALSVSQYPEGQTRHRVLGRAPGGDDILLHEFSGQTKDPEWLEFSPPQPWTNVRHIRVETVSSPSWVAWREIRVLGTSAG
ncbi:MAG: discoidin domain-containing protein [Thermoleophilia bacterium]|nr:discoidin domain-containing protein [Thermoleophilia bacterium]